MNQPTYQNQTLTPFSPLWPLPPSTTTTQGRNARNGGVNVDVASCCPKTQPDAVNTSTKITANGRMPNAHDANDANQRVNAENDGKNDGTIDLFCGHCGRPLEWNGNGRMPVYCSSNCRVYAWRQRQKENQQ